MQVRGDSRGVVMGKQKKEKAQSLGVRKGMVVRLGLIVLATFGSAALAWLFQYAPQHAQATNITQVSTTKKPLGVALGGTNVWVAEPGCDIGLTSTCSSAFPGTIGQYSQANPSGPHSDFTEPNGYSSPAFLALDGNGNVW